MISIINFIYNSDFNRKESIVIIFLCLISVARTSFVKVEAVKTCLQVYENSDVNITCSFTDEHKHEREIGPDKVKVSWIYNTNLTSRDNKQIKEGIKTTWNTTRRAGLTVLHMPTVSKEKEGTYTCLVLISGSVDYKKIYLQVINNAQEDGIESNVENKTDTIRYAIICNILILITILVLI
ncbi:Ig-like domain protein [Fowlpox virus]|nr:Ig-like domain protein [Fowlpox virus]